MKTEHADDGSPLLGPILGMYRAPEALVRLARGAVYALAIDQRAIRLPLILHTVLASTGAGASVVIMPDHDTDQLARQSLRAGVDPAPWLANGRLRMIGLRTEQEARAGRADVHVLTNRLQALDITLGTLVILEAPEAFFPFEDPDAAATQADELQAWAARTQATLLISFVLGREDGERYNAMRAIAEGFSGFALLRSETDHTNAHEPASILEFRHWFGAQGSVPRSRITLMFDDHHRPLVVSNHCSQDIPPPSIPEAGLICRRAAPGIVNPGSNWQVVETMRQAQQGAEMLHQAVVVLPFEQNASIVELARVVVAIRALGRNGLQVVVRECDGHLRLAQTLALVRLGVSLVIPLEVPDAAAQLMLQSVEGTSFDRETTTDIDAALALAARQIRTGELPPSEFGLQTRMLLRRLEPYRLPHTLICFEVRGQTTHRAACNALAQGARDTLFTTDGQRIWAFLSGCPGSQATAVMSRLLGSRFRSLVPELEIIDAPQAMLAALDRLIALAAMTPQPDGLYLV